MKGRELAHLWAHQTQSNGKASNFYFEGDTIYSYGSHFPIARHFKGCVLFTAHGYSSSTARHMSYTRGAIPDSVPVFHVENVRDKPCGKDVHAYALRLDNRALEIGRMRKVNDLTLEQYERLRSEANSFCERFKFKTRFAPLANLDELKEKAKAFAAADKARRERIRKQQEEDAKEKIAQWLAGESVSIPYSIQRVYLRARKGQSGTVNGVAIPDAMQTSKGVTVPLADAEKAFRFVMLKREKGWRRNGETFPVGDFQLDSVGPEGVVAGCHRISWDEIERFAKSQGWTV